MGGLVKVLFGGPKAPRLPPPLRPRPTDTRAQDEALRKAQVSARTRRGRLETIATSARGVFRLGDLAPTRKNLLGE